MLISKYIGLLKYGRHLGRHLGIMHANIHSSQTVPITWILFCQKTYILMLRLPLYTMSSHGDSELLKYGTHFGRHLGIKNLNINFRQNLSIIFLIRKPVF